MAPTPAARPLVLTWLWFVAVAGLIPVRFVALLVFVPADPVCVVALIPGRLVRIRLVPLVSRVPVAIGILAVASFWLIAR